jgi:ferritin-like protein
MGLHEQPDALTPDLVDRHRAIVSLMEELEAVDWYDQRVSAATDPELADILAHNRDEEKEHAAMTLEWLRRRDPGFDQQLRTYLFAEGPVLEAEARTMNRDGAAEAPADPGDTSPGAVEHSLGIGGLKGKSE